MTFTQQQIINAIGEKSLQNSLMLYHTGKYNKIDKLYAKSSENILSNRIAVISEYYPEYASRIVLNELYAEHNAKHFRKETRYWRHDEGPTSNVYDASTIFGRLLTYRNLLKHKDRSNLDFSGAIQLLKADLLRTQALYALLAVPGETLSRGGSVLYTGPIVRAAGLRSLRKRVANPSQASAGRLLAVGQWRNPGPLESAIGELVTLLDLDVAKKLYELWAMPWGASGVTRENWYRAVGFANGLLTGTRIKHPYEVRIYENGTKVTMLLGEIGKSSSAQIRGTVVTGGKYSECKFTTPHLSDRIVDASDAVVSGDKLNTWLKGSGITHVLSLPAEEPILTVRFGPDHDPVWNMS